MELQLNGISKKYKINVFGQFFSFYKTFITLLLVYKADVVIAELLFVELLHSLLSLDDELIIT